MEEAETARTIAQEHGVALLKAECAGISALAQRALGQPEAAESRRAEAVEGYQELGAVKLLERFLQEWS